MSSSKMVSTKNAALGLSIFACFLLFMESANAQIIDQTFKEALATRRNSEKLVDIPPPPMIDTSINSSGEVVMSSGFYIGSTRIPDELEMLMRLGAADNSIELVESQKKDLAALLSEYARDANAISNLDGKKERAKKLAEVRRTLQEGIRSSLLPFQAKLWRSMLLVRNGLPDAICESSLFEGMELSDAEKEQFRSKCNQLSHNLEEDIKRLKIAAYKEAINSLPHQQKKKLDELTSEIELEAAVGALATDTFVNHLKSNEKKSQGK